jgi:hypothetical protein
VIEDPIFPGGMVEFEQPVRIRQFGDFLEVRGRAEPRTAIAAGSIDLATGMFELVGFPKDRNSFILVCTTTAIGQAGPDAETLSGDMTYLLGATILCPTARGMFTGTRLCVGDCNDDGHVMVNELVTSVDVILGASLIDECPSIDADADGQARVDELVAGVNRLLHGCLE